MTILINKQHKINKINKIIYRRIKNFKIKINNRLQTYNKIIQIKIKIMKIFLRLFKTSNKNNNEKSRIFNFIICFNNKFYK